MSAARASPLAWSALVLGIVGINLTLIPGLVGWVLGRRELERIDAGLSPPAGRPLARGAVLLGKLCAVALVVLAVVLLARVLEVE
jgi:hypothetical protein